MIKGISVGFKTLRTQENELKTMLQIISNFDELVRSHGKEEAMRLIRERFPNIQFDSETLATLRMEFNDAYAKVMNMTSLAQEILRNNEV